MGQMRWPSAATRMGARSFMRRARGRLVKLQAERRHGKDLKSRPAPARRRVPGRSIRQKLRADPSSHADAGDRAVGIPPTNCRAAAPRRSRKRSSGELFSVGTKRRRSSAIPLAVGPPNRGRRHETGAERLRHTKCPERCKRRRRLDFPQAFHPSPVANEALSLTKDESLQAADRRYG